MFLTEAKANRLILSIHSYLYTILPQPSLSLANPTLSLSLNPLPISNSFTSPLHLLCDLPLPQLPFTVARYTFFKNFFFRLLSTCPKYFIKFLPILSSALSSHPHHSLICKLLTLSTLLMPHMFLKHILVNTPIFLLSWALNDDVSEPYTIFGITTIPYNPRFTSLNNMFSFHNFAILPRTFLPSTTL